MRETKETREEYDVPPILDMKRDDEGQWVLGYLLPYCLAVELLETVKPINGQP